MAHKSYAGKRIQLLVESDFVSGLLQKENEDSIGVDGYFELNFHTDYTQPIRLKIDQVIAKLYVQPDFVYGITIPEVEESMVYKNDAELEVNIGIIGADSNELNALIQDYQQVYITFFSSEDNRFFSRPMMFRRADSLQKICDTRYANVSNDYFKNYYTYSIASINASVSRGENYLINGYLLNKPIRYHHKEYMSFFRACFSGYLNAMSTSKSGESVYHIINSKADYHLLDAYLKKDRFLKSDSLRELVVIYNLWEYYFMGNYSQDAIKSMLSQLLISTTVSEHKTILNHVLSYMNKMQVGTVAPSFSARTKEGKIASIDSYKGRWIYLNFFSTTNEASMREMPKIASLKKKFGDKVVFVSVCLDDSVKTYINYLRSNPKFNWPIWFNNEKSVSSTAKENYFVTGTEAYFLISNLFYLAQSPALAPSKGIEYRFNLLFKPKRKNTKTGIR